MNATMTDTDARRKQAAALKYLKAWGGCVNSWLRALRCAEQMHEASSAGAFRGRDDEQDLHAGAVQTLNAVNEVHLDAFARPEQLALPAAAIEALLGTDQDEDDEVEHVGYEEPT